MYNVILATDGACSGNPGPGGWGAILTCNGIEKELSGFNKMTTNNRMEFTAVKEGIAGLKKPSDIEIQSDSQLVCDAINELDKRHDAGWKKKTGAKYEHFEILQSIYDVVHDGQHSVRATKVRGHSGHPLNERCDRLAKKQIEQNVG